jgi:LemA protein
MATRAGAHPSHRRDSASLIFAIIALAGFSLLALGWTASTYNRLVRADQEVRARWTELHGVYERRAELVPGLAQGAEAALPAETLLLTRLAHARALVVQFTDAHLQNALDDRPTFERFERAQSDLSASLHRLREVSQAHPELQGAPAFRDLEAQLAGVEDRLSLERLRFNEAARVFNSLRDGLPAMLVARAFGDRFQSKRLFALATAQDLDVPPAARF